MQDSDENISSPIRSDEDLVSKNLVSKLLFLVYPSSLGQFKSAFSNAINYMVIIKMMHRTLMKKIMKRLKGKKTGSLHYV